MPAVDTQESVGPDPKNERTAPGLAEKPGPSGAQVLHIPCSLHEPGKPTKQKPKACLTCQVQVSTRNRNLAPNWISTFQQRLHKKPMQQVP